MVETLDNLTKRLTESLSQKDLEEVLDILDPDGFIIPSEVFSGKGPLGSYYRASYNEGVDRLYGAEDYEKKLEELENQILKELLETIIDELQLRYGANSSEYSFYDAFLANFSPDRDNYEFLTSLPPIKKSDSEDLLYF